jgi:hypothetical protein
MVRHRYLIGLALIIKHLGGDNFLFLNTASGQQIKIDKTATVFYYRRRMMPAAEAGWSLSMVKKKQLFFTDLSRQEIEKTLNQFLHDNPATYTGFASDRFFKLRRSTGVGINYSSPAILTGEIKEASPALQVHVKLTIQLVLLWKIFLTLFYGLLIFLAREILHFGGQKGISWAGIIILLTYLVVPWLMIFLEIRKDIRACKKLLRLRKKKP